MSKFLILQVKQSWLSEVAPYYYKEKDLKDSTGKTEAESKMKNKGKSAGAM